MTQLLLWSKKGNDQSVITTINIMKRDRLKVTRNVSMFHSIPQSLTQDNNTQDNSCDDILPSSKKVSATRKEKSGQSTTTAVQNFQT